MSHNIALARHRYVYVVPEFVLIPAALDGGVEAIPAVWYGVSVTPGRVMGCHVLLENGATVIDLPLHALRTTASACARLTWSVQDACRWDGFGWDAEVFEPPYLSGLSARLLDASHHLTDEVGTLWFALDHVRDGYSMEPAQHKHLWVVERQDGCLVQVPQDQVLVTDASFTEHTGVPRITRQSILWTTEA
jgi:hypothetical protein